MNLGFIRNLSIKNKLLFAVIVPGVMALSVAGVILFALEIGEFRKNAEAELVRLATIIGNRSSAALMFHDTDLAKENLSVLTLQSAVKNACLYDSKGRVFAQLKPPEMDPAWACPKRLDSQKNSFLGHVLTVVKVIEDQQDRVGAVLIFADFSVAYWQKLEFIALMFLVLTAVSIIAFFISPPLIRLISSPVKQLVDTVKIIISTRDYALRAVKVHNDELGVLVDAFNDLIATVQAQNQALIRAKNRYLALFDDNPTMVFNLSTTGEILSVNKTGAKHLGLSVDALQECTIFDLIHPNDVPLARNMVADCLASPLAVLKQEMRQICYNGRIIWARAAARLAENEYQQLSILLVCEDVTETHELSEQIAYQASHDALTGLANRSAFDRTLKEAVAMAHADESEHVFCYLDLDQFKIVNDTCGHLAGDEMLRQIADLLKKHIRRHDFIARLGGDEFGILMYDCNVKDAVCACEKLRDILSDFRFAWENRQFAVGVSIGISVINNVSGTAVNLLKEADAACYAAKEKGRNRVHVFRPDDEDLALRHGEMQWVAKIHQGLEQNQFCLYAQLIKPIALSETGLHLEVLIRYRDNKNAIVPPGAFLPAAERYNLAPALDRWVIGQLFSWLAEQPDFLRRVSLCSVNLSGLSLSDETMLNFIAQQFQHWQIPSEKICFEITETAVIANLSHATKFINELRNKGCSFSLDDFGSGLSSFAYLKNLPVDFLKIDGLFVKDMLEDPVDLAMVKSINEVGHIMGKKTIAEFVENKETLVLLGQLGIDYAQGYYLGKPAPLAEFTRPIPK